MSSVPLRVSAIYLFPFLLCAGSLPQLSVEELVAQSDTIVAGRVVRSWTAMDSENRFIWTHYEIKVGETLKGPAQASLVVGEPGGTLNGVTLLVPGATQYTVGEEVSVFLYRTPIGYLRTTNYGQGKFIFSADGRLHANHAINIGGATIAASASRSVPGTSVGDLEGASWSEFRSQVSRIVANQKEALQ
jgi:hypothetical protein